MALPPLYNVVVRHGPGVRARLTLNEIPFHSETPKNFHGTSHIVSHYLVPGTNALGVEVLDAPVGGHSNFVVGALTKDVDPKEPTVTVCELHWPKCWEPLKEKERVLPFVFAVPFELDHEQPPPPWEGARPEDVPPEGTPELHQAVRQVIEAFQRRDATAFLDTYGGKLTDMARYYPPHDGISRAHLQQSYDAALASPWEVLPYDKDAFVFEPRQQGRAVFVTRRDGEKALSGRNLEDPLQVMETDLIFARERGAWRVVR